MDKKTDLRIKAKTIRKNLRICEISEKLVELIRHNEFYAAAKNIMLYYPTDSEIDLRSLLDDDKCFYFPRVNGDELQVCSYCKGERLEKSKFNILEPCSKPVEYEILDLVIVPALMADKQGYRLGYGGGFYDRFLPLLSENCKTICAMPKELIVNKLPIEEFDVPVNEVIFV